MASGTTERRTCESWGMRYRDIGATVSHINE